MLDNDAFDLLFHDGRTHNAWADKPVPDSLLKQAYDLAKMGPTSMNCSPMRIVFVRSAEAKEKLRPAMAEGNLKKTMAAPATAIIANDPNFFEHMPFLFPPFDGARDEFAGNPALAEETMIRNGNLQAGYFIMACRSVGLDCGPMSGFNKQKVNEAFFKDSGFKANFLINIGYGDPAGLHPRGPRFNFDQTCEIA